MNVKYFVADKDLRMTEPVWTRNLDGVSVQRAFTIPKGSLIEVSRTNAPGMAIEVYPPDNTVDVRSLESRMSSSGKLTPVEQIARFDVMSHDSGSANTFLTDADTFSELYPANSISDIREVNDDEASERMDAFFTAYESAKQEISQIRNAQKEGREVITKDSALLSDIKKEIENLQKDDDKLVAEFTKKYPDGLASAPHKEWEEYDKKRMNILDQVHDLQIAAYNISHEKGDLKMPDASGDTAKEQYSTMKDEAREGLNRLADELSGYSKEQIEQINRFLDEQFKTITPQEKEKVEENLGEPVNEIMDDKDSNDIETVVPDMELGSDKVNETEAGKINSEMRGRANDNLDILNKDGKVDKETREVFSETEKEFSLKELARRGKSIDEQTRQLQENIKKGRLELEDIKKAITNLNVEAEAKGVNMKDGKEAQDIVYKNAIKELEDQKKTLNISIQEKNVQIRRLDNMAKENSRAMFDKIITDPVKDYIASPARNAMEKAASTNKNAFAKMRDGLKNGLESLKGKSDAFAKTWGVKEQEREARYARAAMQSSYAYHKAREEMDKAKVIELSAKRDQINAKQHRLQAKIWKIERNGSRLNTNTITQDFFNSKRENGYGEHRMTIIQRAMVRHAEKKMERLNEKAAAIENSIKDYRKDIEQAGYQQVHYKAQYEQSMQKSVENIRETQQIREQAGLGKDKNLEILADLTKKDVIDKFDIDANMKAAQEAYKKNQEAKRKEHEKSQDRDDHKKTKEDIHPGGRD